MPTDVKVEADEVYANGRWQASPPAAVPDTTKGRQAKRAEAEKGAVSQKRTEQNRRAQVAFRERKRLYVKTLEVQLEAAMEKVNETERIRQENSEMRAMLEALRMENARLASLNARETSTSPVSARLSSDEDSTAADSDDEVPQSPPVNVGKLRAEMTTEPSLLSTVISHLDAEGRFNISNELFFDESGQQVTEPDPLLFAGDGTEDTETQRLFEEGAQPLAILDVPVTPAAFAAAAPNDYFTLGAPLSGSSGGSAGVSVDSEGNSPVLLGDAASPEMVVPGDSGKSPHYCPGCQCDPCICAEMIAAGEPLAAEPASRQKRHIDETTMYVSAKLADGVAPRFFAKNEAAEKDGHQLELCEMMSKTTCKDKNPELRQAPKFIKKTSV